MSGEYLKSLGERHNVNLKSKQMNVKLGDVVVFQDAVGNRGKWNMGIVVKLFQGRDGVVQTVRLRAGKSHLERAVQHMFPLKLSCDQQQRVTEAPSLNSRAREFRPVRNVAAVAAENSRCIVEEKADEH